MDKSVSTWAILSALGIFIVLGTSVPGTLFSMIISGTIPGTAYILPLWIVMSVYPITAIVALLWLTNHTIYIGEIDKPLKAKALKKTKIKETKKALNKQPQLKRRPRTAA